MFDWKISTIVTTNNTCEAMDDWAIFILPLLGGFVRVQDFVKQWLHSAIIRFGCLHRDRDQEASRASRCALRQAKNSAKVGLGLHGSLLHIVEKICLFLGHCGQHFAFNTLFCSNLGLGENCGLGNLVDRLKKEYEKSESWALDIISFLSLEAAKRELILFNVPQRILAM